LQIRRLAENHIKDSLLKCNFFSGKIRNNFLSGEVAENLSLFWYDDANARPILARARFDRGNFRTRIAQERSLATRLSSGIPRFSKCSSHFGTHDGLEGTELGSVKGLIGPKHGEQGMQEFTHYRNDSLEACFATAEQAFIKTP